MRKKQFGRLLTISLSDECYDLVEEIARKYKMSMSGVVRDSIEHSIDQRGVWTASKPRPFTTWDAKRETIGSQGCGAPIKEMGDHKSDKKQGGHKSEH